MTVILCFPSRPNKGYSVHIIMIALVDKALEVLFGLHNVERSGLRCIVQLLTNRTC